MPPKNSDNKPVFIESISLRNGPPETPSAYPLSVSKNSTDNKDISASPEKELNLEQLQFKYAILLDVPVENMLDFRFIQFMENWYGTRYRMGGSDKAGIDCSAFVQTYMSTLYNITLPRTAKEQYMVSGHIVKRQLKEGDLVFFKTNRKKAISHVGVYLGNNKFVHASTSNGVAISDLGEAYYTNTYAGAGRVIGLLQ